jgi:alkylated DNA repair dioxygenase AlkB
MLVEIKDAKLTYVESFLSSTEADRLFKLLRDTTQWVQGPGILGHPEPRLTAYYGDPGADYTYSRRKLTPSSWTPELADIKRCIEAHTAHEFNSLLMNYYRTGRDSVGWHKDRELRYYGANPVIASVSLGAPRRFCLRHDNKKDKYELILSHGSLLVMGDTVQNYWSHSVPKVDESGARVNLTYRRVITLNS